MNIIIEKKEQIFILNIDGRLDAHGAIQFQETWSKNIQDDILCVVLNMGKTDYISSAGLRVLLIIFKTLKARGGTVAITGINSYCRNVMEMAGFADSFPIYNTIDEALSSCMDIIQGINIQKNWDDLEYFKADCGNIRIIPGSKDRCIINVLGDVKNVLYSRITVNDLCSKKFSETEYSIGLGGLGDKVEDYYPLMGEMITIGGTMVWLPTDGFDTPDFLIPKSDKGQVTIRTGFNVSIGGHFNEVIMFQSKEEGGTSINNLYRTLFDMAKKRRNDYRGVLGFAAYTDMSTVLGSGITKSPVIESKPANGEMIVHPSNFKEWFDTDYSPRYTDVTGLICGVGVDLTADLSSYNQDTFNLVFYIHPANVGEKKEMLHDHCVIFKKVSFPEHAVNLEAEIKKIVDEGEFVDMRHLIDSSKITKALIGVCYIQDFHLDPTGYKGI